MQFPLTLMDLCLTLGKSGTHHIPMNTIYNPGLCRVRIGALLAAVSLGALFQTRAAVFALDDGVAEFWGGTYQGDLLALNHYNSGVQTVSINAISVCWNPLAVAVRPRLAVYSDPNGDGSPSDMTLLSLYSVPLQSGIVYLNQSLQTYSITPTTVQGSFFIGAFLSWASLGGDPGIGVDTTPPHYAGQSWIIENSSAVGTLDPNNPIGTSTLVSPLGNFIAGNHVLEAQYTVVPEPGSAALIFLGLTFLTAKSSLQKFSIR